MKGGAPTEQKAPQIFEARDTFSPDRGCKVFSLAYPQSTGEALHSHDYMQIWYVTRGACLHWVEGRSHSLTQGEAFILPPYIAHRTLLEQECEIVCCEFTLEAFTREGLGESMEPLLDFSFMSCFLEDSVRPKFALSPSGQERTEQILRRMLLEFAGEEPYAAQLLRVYILELLLVFAREYQSRPPEPAERESPYQKYKASVERAAAYMEAHYEEPLSLEQICKYAQVSRTYFCSLFKLLTGCTFVEYLSNCRIRRARQLLEDTELSVADISARTGFHDGAHFSRTFHRITGLSPRDYRALRRGNPPAGQKGLYSDE